jgi:phospholipid/cholesterol/gamma-HCH transport system ATP-binding protein
MTVRNEPSPSPPAPLPQGERGEKSSANTLIDFRRAGIAFNGHAVLRDITLAVPAGQTLAVVGESGCGKTVTLKLIVGLLRPTAGQVLFAGKQIADLPDHEQVRQRLRIGFLFQGAALFDSLTVYDNVAFGLRAQRRLGDADIRDRVRRRLQEVGLPDGVERKMPAELSGGMKKRVGLARALVLDPEVMLYDEPTTGLDPIMTDVINELILQTRRRSPITSIVVTHDLKTVYKVADRVVMLHPLARLGPDDPQILFDGTPAELRASTDRRVRQFVEGEAGERLAELRE